MKYQVKNIYFDAGETYHRTPEAACKEAKKREGEGWIAVDTYGNRYTMCDDRAVLSSGYYMRHGWAISWSDGDMPCYQGECGDVTAEDMTDVRLYETEEEAEAEIDRHGWNNCAVQWVEITDGRLV